MYEIVKKFRWEGAHRLSKHRGKCKNIHGHSFRCEVRVSREEGDTGPEGMVADFDLLEEVVGSFIDDKLDHNLILNVDDPLLDAVTITEGPSGPSTRPVFTDKFPFVLPDEPTSENIARYIYDYAAEKLTAHGLLVDSVTVSETESCSATYYGE